MTRKIYKIVTCDEWNAAVTSGQFEGAPVDLADGYIHFSTAEQVAETAARHFSNMSNLLLIAFDPQVFGENLKWEPSRGGDLFPHLYDTLDPEQALAVHDLITRSDGGHDFPEHY